MSNPLVSIIIPCYNQAHFLEKAIQSCCDQTIKEVEIIVINDGSTDNTEEVAKKFSHLSNFKYHHQTNGGLSAARNTGIQLASGKYLQFLDSDDYLHPDKLKIQSDLLEKNHQYAYSYCDMSRVNSDGTIFDNYTVGTARSLLTGNNFRSLLIGGYFAPICPLIKKSVLDQFGYFTPGLDGHADYELWLRLAANNQECIYIDQKLAYYTIHNSNMSKDLEHMNKTFAATIKKIIQEFPEIFSNEFPYLKTYIDSIHAANQTLQKNFHNKLSQSDSELLERLTRENEKLKAIISKFKNTH